MVLYPWQWWCSTSDSEQSCDVFTPTVNTHMMFYPWQWHSYDVIPLTVNTHMVFYIWRWTFIFCSTPDNEHSYAVLPLTVNIHIMFHPWLWTIIGCSTPDCEQSYGVPPLTMTTHMIFNLWQQITYWPPTIQLLPKSGSRVPYLGFRKTFPFTAGSIFLLLYAWNLYSFFVNLLNCTALRFIFPEWLYLTPTSLLMTYIIILTNNLYILTNDGGIYYHVTKPHDLLCFSFYININVSGIVDTHYSNYPLSHPVILSSPPSR